MEIPKIGSLLSEKMHLQVDISKKQIFVLCHLFEGKGSFLEITPIRCMHCVTKLQPYFWNLHKTTDFFIPIKSYFERKKFRTLLSGFGPIFFTKQASSGNNSK